MQSEITYRSKAETQFLISRTVGAQVQNFRFDTSRIIHAVPNAWFTRGLKNLPRGSLHLPFRSRAAYSQQWIPYERGFTADNVLPGITFMSRLSCVEMNRTSVPDLLIPKVAAKHDMYTTIPQLAK